MPESASRPFEPLFGLVALGVASALQSQGYGAALLQHFETLAVTEGIHLVQLSVKMDNQKAIAFYIRNGWFCAERTGDAMVMRKDLSLTRRRRAAGVSQ